MNVNVKYLPNDSGIAQAVQLSVEDWQLLLNNIRQYEQILNIQETKIVSTETVPSALARSEFRNLLLNGPVFSKKQLANIANTRKQLNQFRKPD